ncbi:MAG: glycosyltransferase [bacterium]
MKITLAFDIFNKEDSIAAVLQSWLATTSGKHDIEVIAVYDACVDTSRTIAEEVVRDAGVAYQGLETDDVFEIKANNAALKVATGDLIVFVQDDNLMWDRNWDALLARIAALPRTGAMGLLAGLKVYPSGTYERIECWRERKGDHYAKHNISPDRYPLAAYSVNAINRPFAIATSLLRAQGGLDETYCPMDFDDLSLSIDLFRKGYTNYYIPFAVVNTSAKFSTIGPKQAAANYQHGRQVFLDRHLDYLGGQYYTPCAQPIVTLKEYDGGITYADDL